MPVDVGSKTGLLPNGAPGAGSWASVVRDSVLSLRLGLRRHPGASLGFRSLLSLWTSITMRARRLFCPAMLATGLLRAVIRGRRLMIRSLRRGAGGRTRGTVALRPAT